MIADIQRKTIFAICRNLALDDDDRRAVIERVTGKDSLKLLTEKEAEQVLYELRSLQGGSAPRQEPAQKKSRKPEKTAGATQGQVDKIFALMYDLIRFDTEPKSAKFGERLCGVIERELKINAIAATPFAWMNAQAANKLIECLKGYISTEKRRAGGGNG